MTAFIFLAVCSFVISVLLTPVFRDLAHRYGWLDHPDRFRKKHRAPIPRTGGVAISAAYAGSFAFLMLAHRAIGIEAPPSLRMIWNLLPAVTVVFITGLLDDLIGLTPRQKLLGQAFAAGLACLAGVQIQGVAGLVFPAWLGIPLTVVWLVGCTNAFNLIDGIDGLASGVGLLASITILVAGFLHGDAALVAVTGPLAGALLGFLLFNFTPASIFLGDCGSLLVGFLLACYGVVWSQKAATVLGITAPLLALIVPLADTILAIARRYLRQQSIFSADHDHIHHRLLLRGYTPRTAVLLLYGVSFIAATLSLLLGKWRQGGEGVLVVLFCGGMVAGIQYLRYQEFTFVGRWLRHNGLRSTVKSYVRMQHCEESIRSAETPDECWRAIQAAVAAFGFTHATLRLAGRSYQENPTASLNGCWMLHIPLSESEHLQLLSEVKISRPPAAVAPLADLLHQSLSAKAAHFRTRGRVVSRERAVSAGAGPQIPFVAGKPAWDSSARASNG